MGLHVFYETVGEYTDFFQKTGQTGLVVTLIICLALCFFGFKLWKFWTGLFGFFLGFTVGSLLGSILLNGIIGLWGPLIGGIVLGIVFASIAMKVQAIGLFVSVLLCVFAAIMELFPDNLEIIGIIVGIVVGIIAGTLAVRFRFGAIVAVTGVAGGLLASEAFFELIKVQNIGLSFVVGLLVVMAGIAVQLTTNKDRKKRDVPN